MGVEDAEEKEKQAEAEEDADSRLRPVPLVADKLELCVVVQSKPLCFPFAETGPCMNTGFLSEHTYNKKLVYWDWIFAEISKKFTGRPASSLSTHHVLKLKAQV